MTDLAAGYVRDFLGRLPPNTAADEVRLAADFAAALKAELDAIIQVAGPKVPFVRRIMTGIVNETIDNSIAALAAQTTKTGG